jgi:hypothetical protein
VPTVPELELSADHPGPVNGGDFYLCLVVCFSAFIIRCCAVCCAMYEAVEKAARKEIEKMR